MTRDPFLASLAAFQRGFFLTAVWVILTGAQIEGLILGIAAVPSAFWLSLRLKPVTQPMNVVSFVLALPSFLWGSLTGGIDVARRAFDPRMPLNPGWVLFQTRLDGGARVALGGLVSLLPGTLVASTGREDMVIHVLDLGQPIDAILRRNESIVAAAAGRCGQEQ